MTDQNLYIAIISACSALLGALIGSIGSVVISFLKNLSDERREFNKLTLETAIENWKQAHYAAENNGGDVLPMEQFILHISYILSKSYGKRINKKMIIKIINEANEIAECMSDLALDPIINNSNKG